jgi:hypothetical protein
MHTILDTLHISATARAHGVSDLNQAWYEALGEDARLPAFFPGVGWSGANGLE